MRLGHEELSLWLMHSWAVLECFECVKAARPETTHKMTRPLRPNERDRRHGHSSQGGGVGGLSMQEVQGAGRAGHCHLEVPTTHAMERMLRMALRTEPKHGEGANEAEALLRLMELPGGGGPHDIGAELRQYSCRQKGRRTWLSPETDGNAGEATLTTD